ncbi:MAG: hypothetical protein H7Y17_07610 [Chlorobia bacterium]|nr:hypothetical protein [Fimbriimonadaceae bacterium]
MEKSQTVLRRLHSCGPNCDLLNQVGDDVASLRELVPKLESLRQEDPKNDLWEKRHAEAASMLTEYETRYKSMVRVRERSLRTFRKLRPKLSAESIHKQREAEQHSLKPDLENRFQSLIEELEDLVFELAVTESEVKRPELLTLVDSLSVQIEMVLGSSGMLKASAGIREAALQMARMLDEAQLAEDELAKEETEEPRRASN